MSVGGIKQWERIGVREPKTQDRESVQKAIEQLMPAFVTAPGLGEQAALKGSRWLTVADLSVARQADWGMDTIDRADVGYIFDLAPAAGVGGISHEVLPRGSILTAAGEYLEIWGYGYLAGAFYDLVVADGPLAGRTVTALAADTSAWAKGLPRRTLALGFIVPATFPVDANFVQSRYDQLVELLLQVTPTSRPDRLRCEPIVLASDSVALGLG